VSTGLRDNRPRRKSERLLLLEGRCLKGGRDGGREEGRVRGGVAVAARGRCLKLKEGREGGREKGRMG